MTKDFEASLLHQWDDKYDTIRDLNRPPGWGAFEHFLYFIYEPIRPTRNK